VKYRRLRQSALALVVAAVTPHGAFANGLCAGDYLASINGVSPPIQGKVTGVPNPQRQQPVRVEVQDCARMLVIHGDSPLALRQVANDPTQYIGTQPGMTVVFDIWSQDRLTGQVLMPGVDGSVIYELNLVEGYSPDFEGCDISRPDDEMGEEDRLIVDPALRSEAIDIIATRLGIPAEAAERYISAAKTVAKTRQSDEGVTEILPGEPGCPVELTGVKTCRIHPSDTTTIVEANVLLDKDGLLLPATTDGSVSNRVRVDDPGLRDICAPEATLPPADSRLRFIFITAEEKNINDVQAVLVDAENSHAKKAHYAEGHAAGHKGRTEAAIESYEAIGSPVKGIHK